MLEVYSNLVSAEPYLAVGVVSLMVIDFASGVTKSVLAEKEFFTHYGIRQTLVKVFEYTAFILSIDILLGMTERAVAANLVQVGSETVVQAAYIVVALTEFRSIQENLSRVSVQDVMDVMKGKINLFKKEPEDDD